MIRAAVLGLGKMGISHQSIVNAYPGVELAAICDASDYVRDVLHKMTGVRAYADYNKMFAQEKLDAIIVATPSRFHAEMVGAALDHDVHVFCEKPFCLDIGEGRRLADVAKSKGLVNQVGYHYRFVGSFMELRRLVVSGAIGKIHRVHAEAYGSVVRHPKGSTWRGKRSEGGGCLYDYASHAIDLVNFIVGCPREVSGAVLNQIFSRDVADEVYATLHFDGGATGQVSANWSDDSYRKMSTCLTVWGTNGRITANRQELQAYIRDAAYAPPGYEKGWNVRYTTELTENVWFYLRGEEYSSQIDHFFRAVMTGQTQTRSTFETALEADIVAEAITRNAKNPNSHSSIDEIAVTDGRMAVHA